MPDVWSFWTRTLVSLQNIPSSEMNQDDGITREEPRLEIKEKHSALQGMELNQMIAISDEQDQQQIIDILLIV
uniref:(California timema) hypothetical protein n=1 Tax=Timema californicum TaxID=61474 RepID=A0A7R9JBR5_TIMCA|nr:unnamed protein product [Timema californicum]